MEVDHLLGTHATRTGERAVSEFGPYGPVGASMTNTPTERATRAIARSPV
jgi:hypothetical protein